ncbi:hypothetical protein [Nevskia sp.]|uniref:hypothetical protein n=1 Tax=Nevskia sp. TaxID=1929292 RepID=UPI0025D7483C|nr:hypothetical protein [Nevskia sp.]
MTELQTIYLGKISEALARLAACERLLGAYGSSKDVFSLESAVLQIRKALEAVAFAAIAPNKTQYAEYRAQADKNSDLTKDFNARSILQFLGKINSDFYPVPASAPIAVSPGNWRFDRRQDNSLSKDEFESFYDRLGKHLHADNPWGNDKGLNNLAKDIPEVIAATRSLLSWHFTTIRTPQFSGVWVVEAPSSGVPPRVIVGQASGEFVVQ